MYTVILKMNSEHHSLFSLPALQMLAFVKCLKTSLNYLPQLLSIEIKWQAENILSICIQQTEQTSFKPLPSLPIRGLDTGFPTILLPKSNDAHCYAYSMVSRQAGMGCFRYTGPYIKEKFISDCLLFRRALEKQASLHLMSGWNPSEHGHPKHTLLFKRR